MIMAKVTYKFAQLVNEKSTETSQENLDVKA